MLTRLAAVPDIAGIASMVERYWQFESIAGFELRRIEALLGHLLADPERGACWVVEADGRLCGYLLAVFMFSLEHGGMMAEVDELFVSRDARSSGAGSQLLARAERDLGQRGLVRLQLELAAGNERARHFYRRHGFRPREGYELLAKAIAAT
jgi:ribosomal protein S18 acetylase RimI-like enzyme